MDDFRVSSVPSSEPYGEHHAYGSVERKRQRHHHEEHGGQDEPADTFEAALSEEAPSEGEQIEDYYRPSEPADEE